MTAATLAFGNRWPAAAPGAAGRAPVTLAQCVLLALLLHLWALLVLGTVPGGSAPPGAGQGGTLNITLRGPVDPGLRVPRPAQAPPAYTGPTGSAAVPRWGGAVRETAPVADSPGAARQGLWQPQPGRDLLGPLPATSRVQPVQDEQAVPAGPPAGTEPPVLRTVADLPPAAAVPAPALTVPLSPLRPAQPPALPALPALAALPELPEVPALPAPTAAVAPPALAVLQPPPQWAVPGAPPAPAVTRPLPAPQLMAPPALPTPLPVPARPAVDVAPAPLAEPPPPALSELQPSLPAVAPPLAPLTSPTPLPATTPSVQPPPLPSALPLPPLPPATGPIGLDGLPRVPAPGAPDAGAQVGQDVATPAAAAASAPRLNLELARPRGGELSRLPSPGLLAVMPRPPEAKTQLERELEQAARPDCRNAHGNKGLLAVVPLVVDTVRGTGCRW